MPIYEYKCSKCNGIFEHFQRISDDPLKTCLICGSKNTVSKIISSSAFRLNGTGWYETDFKNAKKKTTPSDTKKCKSESKTD
tara:strand:- start:124 stop:369 length:246 start_codon:yes stop_codon:yes gene_type:complete